ncbi:hypothetical protein ACG7TL_008670 [Trametes sanguinea]
MVAPTFILTRAFAISALFVGAFRYGAEAAPVPSEPVPTAAAPQWETLGRRSLLDTVLTFTSGGKHQRVPPRPADAASPPTFAFLSQAVSFVKRSCRQQGCLDKRTVNDTLPQLRQLEDVPDPEAGEERLPGPLARSPAITFSSPPPPPVDAVNANVARSCRQVGCLRDTDTGGALDIAAEAESPPTDPDSVSPNV